jgi:DNA-directed RNA polymerase specialized sigma24 family protein
MKPEIEKYITINYYDLLKVCKKYTKNDDWASELLHEVILQIYDSKSLNNMDKLQDKNIKYYIIRIITVNWCYETSPFYRKYKKPAMNTIDLTEAMSMAYQDEELNQHEMMELMEEEWAELDWFRKNIFERYLTMGSLKKVSKDTTIPLTSIARYIKTAKTDIKHNVFKKMK